MKMHGSFFQQNITIQQFNSLYDFGPDALAE
jgi:hypothetical protein